MELVAQQERNIIHSPNYHVNRNISSKGLKDKGVGNKKIPLINEPFGIEEGIAFETDFVIDRKKGCEVSHHLIARLRCEITTLLEDFFNPLPIFIRESDIDGAYASSTSGERVFEHHRPIILNISLAFLQRVE